MRIYLAGPMRGIKNFNFEAFDAAKLDLLSWGHDVFSPADMDREMTCNPAMFEGTGDALHQARVEADGFSLRKALAADTRAICEWAEAVAYLPGSAQSSGACAEVALAKALGLKVAEVEDFINPLPGWSRPEEQTLEAPPRVGLLQEAIDITTGDRNVSYGSPIQNFQNTADLWNVQFGHKLKDGESFTPADIAQAMMHLKLARMIAQPKRDNYLDLAGYAACGWECEADVTT